MLLKPHLKQLLHTPATSTTTETLTKYYMVKITANAKTTANNNDKLRTA